ncbi:hypothetical protein BpHYR1_041343 [Brachionus plicatilis]|uniref:Uncharacterized protein n=1 Tax=Brachionus plicatilis TaxID=10195 RepID=A0A3M7PFX1_BRAPC|nr:hypothetical protein BpHYR1_041343 [Brachionus plicatilis]
MPKNRVEKRCFYIQNQTLSAAIKTKIFFEALLFYLNFYYKRYVYVRPCTKYPTHGIKACVAKQGDTETNDSFGVPIKSHESFKFYFSNKIIKFMVFAKDFLIYDL